MKKYILVCSLFFITPLWAKVSADRIKGWLELDATQKNIENMITKYNDLDAQLKNDANELLQQSIDGADEIAESDPYAALIMYHKIKTLKDVTNDRSLEIAEINKKFKELSLYIDKQYKELHEMRRKHLQFPC